MREITLISVTIVFPLSIVEGTVCLHSFSLLRILHACYSNEEKRVKRGAGLSNREQDVKSPNWLLMCARKMDKRLIIQLSGFIAHMKLCHQIS